MEPHPSVISSCAQTQDCTELFLSFRARPPSHPCLLLNTEGFFLPAPELPWQQALETAARSLGGGGWQATAGSQHGSPPGSLQQGGKAQRGAGAAALEVASPPLWVWQGSFSQGKKSSKFRSTGTFLPWVSWSYRCFQTSWWFGLQLFGLMAVYLSNRCRTSMLELGVFFFSPGLVVCNGNLQSHFLLRSGSEKHLFDMIMRGNQLKL